MTGSCEFRCRRDANCLSRCSQVCDGKPDCADHSDEAKCPPSVALLQPPFSQHQNQQSQPPYADLMQEISGVQICIVAVALVLTLGLITCVINHYNKMGARSWSGDQRRHDHSRKTNSATATLALYSPSKAQERARKEMLLCQEHQMRMLSVQRDFALNLPSTVHRPNSEESQCQRQPLNSRGSEVPRAYVRPPPNRTIAPPYGFMKSPLPEVHRHSTYSVKTVKDYNLVTNPSFHHTAKRSSPPLSVRVSGSIERWHRSRVSEEEVCTIAIFEDTVKNLDSDDPPPKYEDVIQETILPSQTSKNQTTYSSVTQPFQKTVQ